MVGNKEMLQRQIQYAESNIKTLEERKEILSEHGYWDLGYWKGRLTVLEDWLDDLNKED